MKILPQNWREVLWITLLLLAQAGCSYLRPPTDRSPYSEEIDRSREPARQDMDER